MKKNILLVATLSLALVGCFGKKKETQKETSMAPQPLVEESASQNNNPKLPPGHPPINGNPHAGMGMGMNNPHGMMGGMMAITGVKPTPQVPEDIIKLYPGANVVFVDQKTQQAIKKAKMKLGDSVEVNGYKVKLIYVIPDLKVGDKGYFVASLEPRNPALWIEIYKDGKLIFRGPVFANFPTLTDPKTGFFIFVESIMTTKKEMSSSSVWNKACAACHGTMAPSKEALLSKFKTKDEFLKAAQAAVKNKKMPPNLPFEAAANELYSK